MVPYAKGLGSLRSNSLLSSKTLYYQLFNFNDDDIDVGLAVKVDSGTLTVYALDPPIIVCLEEN